MRERPLLKRLLGLLRLPREEGMAKGPSPRQPIRPPMPDAFGFHSPLSLAEMKQPAYGVAARNHGQPESQPGR